jgi:ribose/xylose/arabinose/galactoside ABC-type transport system permease subunit
VNISFTLIVAFPLNLLMISGGIDLSVGSVMGLAACTMAAAIVQHNQSPVTGIIIGLLAAVIVGILNGIFATKLKLPPLLVTLGMLILVRGLCYIATRYFTIQLTEEFAGKLIIWLGKGKVLGCPFPIFIAIILFIICFIIQSKTAIGRNLFAIGGKEETARLSGIKVDKTRMIFYVFTAFSAGISGILLAGILQSAQPVIGTGMEFRAITAILVGGTSLFGGRGSVVGTVLGAILVGIVFNAAVILNLPFFATPVIEGSIIILAVLLDTQMQKRFARAMVRARRPVEE